MTPFILIPGQHIPCRDCNGHWPNVHQRLTRQPNIQASQFKGESGTREMRSKEKGASQEAMRPAPSILRAPILTSLR
jgi:hypothetical protein